MSVHGNLLFMSVEQTRGRLDCGTQGVQDRVSTERFRGVRIFDISDLKKPKQVAAVQTCRGSHTHTLVTDPERQGEHLHLRLGHRRRCARPTSSPDCSGKDPKDDPNTALFSIDVIKVPLAAPEKAAIVNRPRIFADPTDRQRSPACGRAAITARARRARAMTNQCHDITVFPEIGLAAGACSGNGILLDISDPVNPVRLDQVIDKNFAYWHSATFNNDGTKVIFTDEWGGGTRPRCRATDLPNWGANAIFDIVDRKLKFAGYYKLPAPQTEQENCVAHNGSLIPVPGRDIMVQAWYQGGISVFDFTDPAKPVEIAYFDRGPLDAKQLITGGFWSAYWYNGHIYGAEIARGIDVFQLTPSEFLTQNEIDAALLVQRRRVQRAGAAERRPGRRAPWSRARTSISSRAPTAFSRRGSTAVNAALDRAREREVGEGQEGARRSPRTSTSCCAASVEGDAGAASGRDAARLKALAESLKAQSARLR